MSDPIKYRQEQENSIGALFEKLGYKKVVVVGSSKMIESWRADNAIPQALQGGRKTLIISVHRSEDGERVAYVDAASQENVSAITHYAAWRMQGRITVDEKDRDVDIWYVYTTAGRFMLAVSPAGQAEPTEAFTVERFNRLKPRPRPT